MKKEILHPDTRYEEFFSLLRKILSRIGEINKEPEQTIRYKFKHELDWHHEISQRVPDAHHCRDIVPMLFGQSIVLYCRSYYGLMKIQRKKLFGLIPRDHKEVLFWIRFPHEFINREENMGFHIVYFEPSMKEVICNIMQELTQESAIFAGTKLILHNASGTPLKKRMETFE